MTDEGLEFARAGDGGMAAIDAAYECGELDRDGWHDAVRALIVPAYLGESVHRWGEDERGLRIEPYGVDIAPEHAELARRRLPQCADHDRGSPGRSGRSTGR